MRTLPLRPVLARTVLAAAFGLLLAGPARATEVFSKPPSPVGGVNYSSWTAPNGSDSDRYAWDDFTLSRAQTITEVRWRGGYALGASSARVTDFRISFFDSNINGNEPYIVALPEHEDQEIVIATFHTNNNAGESAAGVYGGVAMYDYHYRLPTPVTLQGGVKYWFRVVAAQATGPDWGMTTGTGGDGSHFRYTSGLHMFQFWPHDLAFSLHARWADLGNGLAGTAGVPRLSGSGTLAGGSSCSLALSLARPSSTLWMVIGLTEINAPFKGGTLVPDPLFIVSVTSDGLGAVQLPFVMPLTAPSGRDFMTQAWIVDPAAVHGFAASNGLAGTTP